MATFQFVYDDEGPHLNPSIMEMLKPEVGVSPKLLSGDAASPGAAGERLNGGQDVTPEDAELQLQVRNAAGSANTFSLPEICWLQQSHCLCAVSRLQWHQGNLQQQQHH